ncbi:MAG: hypothetical protein GY898_01995 [Proteobacteria bacterium]|nr:hypothetical protein [Pseudomonadota bacterium]
MAQIVVSYPGPHYVWTQGMSEWLAAEQVPEIANLLAALGGQTVADGPGPSSPTGPVHRANFETARQPAEDNDEGGLSPNKLIFIGIIVMGGLLVCGLGVLEIAGSVKDKQRQEDLARRAAMATPAPTPEITPEPTPPLPPPLPRIRALSERPASWNRIPLKDRRKRHGEGVASSELLEGNGTLHAADRIGDVKGDTAWCESAPDDGIGEWVELWLDCGPSTSRGIRGMGVRAGYGRTETFWRQNNRVSDAIISVDVQGRDAFIAEVMFDDQVGQMYVPFDSTVRCDPGETIRAKLEIVEVVEGTKYTDTCVSTMSFYGPLR